MQNRDVLFTPDPLNRSHPLAHGLKGFWTSGFGLSGSRRMFDLVANHHGDLENYSEWTESPVGTVLSLHNNAYDRVAIPNSSSLSPSGDFTITAYVRQNSDITYETGMQDYIYPGIFDSPSFKLYLTPASITTYIMGNDGPSDFSRYVAGLWYDTITTPLNEWMVLTVSFRQFNSGPFYSGDILVYINGLLVGGSGSVTNNAIAVPAISDPDVHYIGYGQDLSEIPYTGIDPTDGSTTFDGDIASVLLHHRCLSPAEVKNLSDILRSGGSELLNTVPNVGLLFPSTSITYNDSGSGGAEGGGSATVEFWPIQIRGGVVCGGTSNPTQSVVHIVASGSFSISGAAKTLFKNRFESEDNESPDVGGSASVRVAYRFRPDGQGSDAPPAYSGVTVGYQNGLTPTIAYVTEFFDYDLHWRRDQQIALDIGINWNTGKDRQYWYRIIGKGRPMGCDPLDVGDPCCMRYTMNVHARSIDQLCAILKERRWKWPIESVERYTRPAENSEVAADEAAGINHDCNRLLPVLICTHKLCEDFCVDNDLKEDWGVKTSYQRAYVVEGSSGISVSGQGEASLFINPVIFTHEADGGLDMGGECDFVTTGHGVYPEGGVVMGGTCRFRSRRFRFTGGLYPFSTSPSQGKGYETFGSNTDADWIAPERILISDGLGAVSDVSYAKTSQFLVLNNLGLQLPEADNEVVGIEVRVSRRSGTAAVQDHTVCLVMGETVVSENKAKTGINWPVATPVSTTYGSALDDWREEDDPWTISDLNDPSFGVALRCVGSNLFAAVGHVDYIDVIVYFAETTNQLVRMGGEGGIRAEFFNYSGEGGFAIGETTTKVTLHGSFTGLGLGDTGPLFTSVTIGGECYPRIHAYGSGGPIVSGEATTKTERHYYTGSGEILCEGEARERSSNYHWTSSGNVEVGTSTTYGVTWQGRGGAVGGGSAESIIQRYYEGSGDIDVGGEARTIGANVHWVSTGSITMGGAIGITTYDPYEQFIGISSEILDFKVNFAADEVEEAEEVVGTVDACGCIGLPLSLTFNHNMATNNKFSQFLLLNNITLPSILTMRYNNVNDLWQYNAHYRGQALNRLAMETWNLNFGLQCTSMIGSTPIGLSIWKLTMQLRERNLTTNEDFDTKIVVGFLPDQVCSAGKDFKFKLTLDTVTQDSVISPASTIYQSLLYDNIGLFKEPYWLANPEFTMTVSQIGFSNPSSRQSVFNTVG
jgi:hypothetical protein